MNNNIILIADDEERNLKLMEAMLLPLGLEVIMAHNGEQVLDVVRRRTPDLILLDVVMPIMNGFQALKELKNREDTRFVPVVMVTALKEQQDRIKALEVGADDFLTKPVEVTELRARVKNLLKVKAYYDHMRNHQKVLEAEVARRTRQLTLALERNKKGSLETIYRLARAAEFRDEETSAHLKRMSHYAAAIAVELGLNERTVEAILYAAPMHDVGKIGIPDHILLKPGKLDASEWEIMKRHTLIGAKILEGSDTGFIKLAEVVALTHHEKWDGSGYPHGLEGCRIPLAGRIAAIADVFDALTSERPYKKAFSIEKSFEIIRDLRGNHFDPRVVDAFFSVQRKILSIKDSFQDSMMEEADPAIGMPLLQEAKMAAVAGESS